ncbi:MAG: BLUF domain-containing protein [Chromatiaceae bacterium]|nr:MAG: BLUF domain-containing protein [Chromatiaceae bacterium]
MAQSRNQSRSSASDRATPRCRLIYRSICSASFLPNEDLRQLVSRSAEHNRAAGIAGLLLLSGDRFLQVLEGPAAPVNRLFGRIMRDPRHHDIEIIAYEQIGPSYFDDWAMHLVDLFDLSRYPRDYLARKYRVENGVVQIPERLHEVYGLLLDARALCTGRPWEEELIAGPTPVPEATGPGAQGDR